MTRKAVFHDTGAYDEGAGSPLNIGQTVKVFSSSGTVDPATTLHFVGAAVSAPGGGTADITVSGGTASSVSFGTPAPTWGTANAPGTSDYAVRTDATYALFSPTGVPSTQAFGDSASAGTATYAPRLDHKHAMPANPVTKGTAFPGSPSTDDTYYRTNILGGTWFKYDGTRWRSVHTFEMTLPVVDAAMSAGISVTTNNICRTVVPWQGTYGFYALTCHIHTIVLTTNDGTKNWTVTLFEVDSSGATVASNTASTSADTAGTHVYHTIARNAVVSSTVVYFQLGVTKVSTPGNIFVDAVLSGQLIAT